MRYLPLVWAAFRRHTTESLLTFLVLTVAFTLFSAMLALRAAYDHAIQVNRMDRLLVTARFCCTGLNIARRADIERIAGVRGVGLIQGVFGYHQEPSMQLGVWTIDAGTIAAIPELRLTAKDWKLLQATPNGLLFTRTLAAVWKVKAGDAFPVKTSSNRREDHAVLGTALAAVLSSLTSRLGEGSGLTLPAASISGSIVALALGVALLMGALSAVLPLRRLRTMELAPALALAGL